MKLVGTNHSDLLGPKRLEYLLETDNPKVITVELPSNLTLSELERRIIEAKKMRIELVRSAHLPRVAKRFLTGIAPIIFYQTFVPLQYSRKTGASVHPVDHPSTAIRLIRVREDTQHNLADIENTFKSYGVIDKLIMRFCSFQYFIENYIDIDSYFSDEENYITPERYRAERYRAIQTKKLEVVTEEREQFMAERIARIRPDMHIGGLAHMFEGYLPFAPLCARLGALVTERIRLCDVKLPDKKYSFPA